MAQTAADSNPLLRFEGLPAFHAIRPEHIVPAITELIEHLERELEVLRLVAAGRSTRDIATQLNRSVKTIETHKQSIKSKLEADSPAMLVRKAIAYLGEGG